MAQQFEQIPNNIEAGEIVRAGHVSQSLVAFTGQEAYDITISGSLTVTGSIFHDGAVDAGGALSSVVVRNSVTGEYQLTGSYYDGATSGTSGTSGTGGTSGTSGIDGTSGTSGTTATSLTLGQWQQPCTWGGQNKWVTSANWSMINPGSGFFINNSGTTKHYVIVLTLTYTGQGIPNPIYFPIEVGCGSYPGGPGGYTTFGSYRDSPSPITDRPITHSYTFFPSPISDGNGFAFYVRNLDTSIGLHTIIANAIMTLIQVDDIVY